MLQRGYGDAARSYKILKFVLPRHLDKAVVAPKIALKHQWR